MAYTAPTKNFLKNKLGTDSTIMASELSKIDTAIGSAEVKIVDLTASAVSSSSLAANGIDLASGSNHTFYAVFLAPVDCTIVSMDLLITEDYVKETTDAKVELKTEEDTPVTLVTCTLDSKGVAARTVVSTEPTIATLSAGDIVNIVTTETASTSGTGHAKVFLRYIVD